MTPAPSAAGPTPMAVEAAPPRIWTREFVLLFLASALGYAHFGLLGPTIPLYLTSLGHTEWVVGLVVAAFSVTSFMLRPYIGYLADTWSVRGVLCGGALLLGLSAAAAMTPFAIAVGVVNGVRGIGWAALNTGANTLLAHAAPHARRAEAAGYLAVSHGGPAQLGPPLALWILAATGTAFGPVFLLAALTGLGAAVLAWRIPSPPSTPPSAVTARGEPVGLRTLFDRGVLLPTLLLVSLAVIQPAITAFVPLFARQLGVSLDSLAWYYLASASASLGGRLLLGRAADRAGRGAALGVGFSLAMLGLALMASASSLIGLVVAGVLLQLGSALNQPSTTALAIDRADPHRRGRSMASFSLGNQLGAGVGAVVTGVLAELVGYAATYAVLLLSPGAGLALLAASWRGLQRPRA